MERARSAGLLVDMVVVRDDCALVGQALEDRRGLAGTIFIHKVLSAGLFWGPDLAQWSSVAGYTLKSQQKYESDESDSDLIKAGQVQVCNVN